MVYKARTFFFTKGVAKNMDQNKILYESKLKIKQIDDYIITKVCEDQKKSKKEKSCVRQFLSNDKVYTECPNDKRYIYKNKFLKLGMLVLTKI